MSDIKQTSPVKSTNQTNTNQNTGIGTRLNRGLQTSTQNIGQMAGNVGQIVQEKYTPQQIKHFLTQNSQLRALRRRNFQLPETSNGQTPILDEEVCEQVFSRMNGLTYSSRFLQAKSKRYFEFLQNSLSPDQVEEELEQKMQAALAEAFGEDAETPANQYVLTNYLLKQNRRTSSTDNPYQNPIEEQLKKELDELYQKNGKEITAGVNCSIQASQYSEQREKIKLFHEAYYQLLETVVDVPTMMEYYFTRFSLDEFMQVSNLITQAAIAHQQAHIMPCLHRESVHALLAFMNQRTLLYSCIYSIRALLLAQKIIEEKHIPIDSPQQALKKLKERESDQNDKEENKDKEEDKNKDKNNKEDAPQKVSAAEKILRDILKMLLDLTHGKVILSLDEQIRKINEKCVNYSKLTLRQVNQAERKALQALLKLIREQALQLWQDDATRHKTLEAIYEILGEYSTEMVYTPFNRDKFFI